MKSTVDNLEVCACLKMCLKRGQGSAGPEISQANPPHTSNHDKDKAKVKKGFFAQPGNVTRVNHFKRKGRSSCRKV